MRIKLENAYENIRIYYIIIIVNFLHVSVTFCGCLQEGVISKDILKRQPNHVKIQNIKF